MNTLFFLMIMIPGRLEDAQRWLDKGSPDKALPLLMAEVKEAPSAQALKLAVHTCTQLGDFEQGLQLSDQALEYLPQDAAVRVDLAVLYRTKFTKNPMGWMTGRGTYIELLEKAVELDAAQPRAYQELIGFYANAPAMVGGSTDKALQWCDRLTEVDLLRGKLERAQVYVTKGDEAEWRSLFAELIKTHSDPTLNYRYGMALQSVEAYESACAQFEQAMASGHLPSMYQAGKTRVIGSFELPQAIELFDRYLEAQPDSIDLAAGAWWRKGQAMAKLGRTEEARSCFETSLKINDDETVRADLKRLAKD